jgi:hypothetical protein
MKTIIQVWTHKCVNISPDASSWGLGDILRGTIKLYQLCKENNYRFIVDMQLHNLSNYLVHRKHEYSDLIQQNKDNILFVYNDELENYIFNNDKNILYFFTNSYCNENLDYEKEFIQNLLTPNHQLKEYISNKILDIPDNYNILHYRLGDDDLVRNENNHQYDVYLNHLKKNIEENDVFISDSNYFKKIVCRDDTQIRMVDVLPRHIGYDGEPLNDTLFEFFLITKCQKIKTYSKYSWISGFVYWIHKVYDIPLVSIAL